MIDFNREKYDTHMQAINNESRREFSEIFDKYQKESLKKYANNFTQKYNNWQEKHIS